MNGYAVLDAHRQHREQRSSALMRAAVEWVARELPGMHDETGAPCMHAVLVALGLHRDLGPAGVTPQRVARELPSHFAWRHARRRGLPVLPTRTPSAQERA
jgi:hypothetical protein